MVEAVPTKTGVDAVEADVLRQIETLDYDSDSYYDDVISLISQSMTKYAAEQDVDLLLQPWAPFDSTLGIEITDFFAATPGGGKGTLVMQRMARLADVAMQAIYLRPSSGRNREFYARFGFTEDRKNYGFLVRFPTWNDEDLDEAVSELAERIRQPTPPPEPWLSLSWAVNDQKEPLRVYRGQHGGTSHDSSAVGLQSTLASITFTPDPAVASTYAMRPNDWRLAPVAPRVIPAYLDIRQPIFWLEDEPFVDFSMLSFALGADTALRFARKFSSHVEDTNLWADELSPLFKSVDDFLNNHPERVNELYVQAWVLLDDFAFVQAAKDAGYDGAMSLGSGESALIAEYRIFDVAQYKPAAEWQTAVDKRVDLLAQFHRENEEAEQAAFEDDLQREVYG